MKFAPILLALLLASCTRDLPSNADGLYVPNQPIIAGDAWAYDAKDPRYGSGPAREIRFRDAWMSFHNYFSPSDVRAHNAEFETWFSQTSTGRVDNGDEYQFTLDLFR